MAKMRNYFSLLIYSILLDSGILLSVNAQSYCHKDGKWYREGDVITENCNQCTCVQVSSDPLRYSFTCTDNTCLIQQSIINRINTRRYGWDATNYSKFWGLTLDEGFRWKLGTHIQEHLLYSTFPIQVNKQTEIPISFDSRERWGDFIHPPQDQGNCGSSWAFSTAGVVSDRVAIITNGSVKDMLSPQHLLSCSNNSNHDGCNGGYIDRAWNYIRRNGILQDECYLYTSGETGKAGQCFVNRTKTIWGCSSVYRMYIHTTPAYRIANQETDIMVEIMKNGPVQALMTVDDDFFVYKSGIYRPSTARNYNDPSRYHSVRIIGWGEEMLLGSGETIKYWLCVNSWGKWWGENGLFRIERGKTSGPVQTFVIGVHIAYADVFETPFQENKERNPDSESKPPREAVKAPHYFLYTNHLKQLRKKLKRKIPIRNRSVYRRGYRG